MMISINQLTNKGILLFGVLSTCVQIAYSREHVDRILRYKFVYIFIESTMIYI